MIQADLDASPVIRGRSVMLRSKDGHGTWVSGRVLQDIRPLPHAVEGGVIVRDKKGKPIGKSFRSLATGFINNIDGRTS